MLCPCGTGIKWSRVSSRLQTHEITHLCGHVTLSKSGPWQSRFLWDCPMVLLSRSLASVSEESSDPLHMDAKHVETAKYSFTERERFFFCKWSWRQTNAFPGFHIVRAWLSWKESTHIVHFGPPNPQKHAFSSLVPSAFGGCTANIVCLLCVPVDFHCGSTQAMTSPKRAKKRNIPICKTVGVINPVLKFLLVYLNLWSKYKGGGMP